MTLRQLKSPKEFIQQSEGKLKKFNQSNLEFSIAYLANIFKSYCLDEINTNELLSLPNLSDEYQQVILEAIESRRSEVSKFLLFEHNSQSSRDVLLNFDWEVNWIIGSSSMASTRQQMATLILNSKNGNVMKSLTLELDRNMVNKIIQVLEQTIEAEEIET